MQNILKKKRWLSLLMVFVMILQLFAPWVKQPIEASGTIYVGQGAFDENYGIFNINGIDSQIARITIDGTPSLCVQQTAYGVNYQYTRGAKITDPNMIKALNYIYTGTFDGVKYMYAQAYIWGHLTGKNKNQIISDMVEIVHIVYPNLAGVDETVAEIYYDNISRMSAVAGDDYYYWNTAVGQNVISMAKGTKIEYPIPRYEVITGYATTSETVNVKVVKTDNTSGKPLQDVTFDLYRDDVLWKSGLKTDANGEINASYKEDFEYRTGNYTYCTNYNQLDAADKAAIDNNPNIYSSREAAQQAANAKAQTEVNKKLNKPHTYKVVETETKTAYWLDANGNTVSADKSGSGTVTLSLTNQAQLGSIELTKLDDQTLQGLAGFGFDLYARENILDPADGSILFAAGTKVASFPLTDANGKTRLDGLYLGTYFWKETSVNTGYLIDPTEHNVTLSYKGSAYQFTDTATATHQNTAVRGSTTLIKQDADTHTSVPQGDATIEGAVYGLYAKNNITHPDGHTGIITYDQIAGSNNQIRLTAGTDLQVTGNRAVAGALLATIKTDANGKFGVENLYLGDYYWKELTPSQGYLKDPVQHDFTLSYAGQNVPVVTSSTTSYEQVMKQAFDIFKAGHVPGTSMHSTPLAGAEFTVWLESDIQTLINQGHTLEEAKELATVYDVLITATDGTASSIELPFGYYRVAETVTPRGHITANDFFITVDHDDRTHQSWTNNVIVNEMFTSYLKIVKKNSESNKTVLVPGAEYKIKALTEAYVDGRKFNAGEYIGYFTWNPFQGFWVDSWKTDATGSVMLNEKLSFGKYQLEEITAPEGHVLNPEPIEFEIVQSDMVELLPDGSPLITVVQKNDPVKGQIETHKKGEELTGVRQNEDGSYSFIYEEKPQGETVFEIAAAEDILDPADHSVIYAAGTLIETVTTDADGKVVSSLMPLGKYKVTEKTVKDGMVLNTEVKTITLEYQDENTPIVKEVVEFINDRQKVKIEAFKQDIDTQERLAGAEITLTLVSDLLDANGNVILPAGKIIEKQVTDENGEAHFEVDLPVNAQFILSETKEPIGYLPTDATYSIDTTWQGQDVEVQSYTFTFENKITEVEIIKTDASTGQYLPNVILGVYPVNDEGEVLEGECFATFKTENAPTILKGLEPGKYVLRELVVPYDQGYVKADDVVFEVRNTVGVQKVEMKDDFTKVEIIKVDKFDHNLFVKDAQLSLIPVREDGTLDLGAAFDTWITTDEAHHMERIPVGKYVIRETLGQAYQYGYVTADDMEIEIKDTPELQKFVMEDDHTRVEISKTDIANGDYVLGSELSVIPLDENGEPLVGETFDTWITTDEAHMIEYLPIGDYILREKLTGQAWDYGYVTADDVKFTVKDTAEVQKVEMKDDFTKVEIIKVDKFDHNLFVKDAQLSLIPVKEDGTLDLGAAFDTWITTDEAHHMERIPVGKYVIRETLGQAYQYGYVTADDMEIEIKDTPELQKFVMEDDHTRIIITKVNKDTDAPIPGTIFTLIPFNDEGELMKGETFLTAVTDENGQIKVEYVPVGKYALRELSSVFGFVKHTEDILLEVTDNPEPVHVRVENELETGRLIWNKTGKIFLRKEISESDYGTVETPMFEMSNILGAEITIYAAEDITLNGKTYYSKDEAIQVLESDWDPVESQDLYPGKYYYVETKTPHGMVPDTEKHFFEIEWNGTDEVEKVESTLVNVRPNYQIDFTKTLEENDVLDPEAYKNVLFGIYAREDIYDYMGYVAIEAGTLIAVSGIDEEGHLVNVPELPVGQFYLKELSTDVAYILDETEYDFTIKQSSEKAVMIPVNDSKPVENILKRTTIHFNKVDAQTGEAVISKDFVFTRYADPECKQKIESVHANTEDGYAEFNIAYGTWYIKESEAPLGYKISDEVVKVTFNEDGLFINGQKVEAESEGIYSYRYVNTLLPSSVITSDSQNMIMWQLTLLVSALLLVLFMMSKKIENMNA